MGVALANATDTRRRIDLEALVTWAIRDQKADRTDTALHPVEAIAHIGKLRGLPIGAVTYGTRISGDGCAVIANRNEVGAVIDGGGAIRGVPPRVHPDAELVADAIERLPGHQRRLVLHHARHGDRPEWLPLVSPLVAVKRPSESRGRYRHMIAGAWEATPLQSEIARGYFARGISLFDKQGRRRIAEEERGFRFRVLGDGTRQVLVKWCPLEPLHSEAEIAEANAGYSVWYAGMAKLHQNLAGRVLSSYQLGEIDIPRYPWLCVDTSTSSSSAGTDKGTS